MVARRNLELLDGGMIPGLGDEGRLYDHVLLSPYALTREDVIHSRRLTGPNIPRDFAALTGTDPGRVNKAEASTWYHEKYLDRGLTEGWLAEVDGYIVAATPPPGHTPMTSQGPINGQVEMSGAPEEVALNARRILHHTVEQERAALKLLHHRGNVTRVVPKDRGAAKKSLRQSIERIGQVAPIIRWPGMKDGEEVIIDGQTRLEVCAELGIEPWVIDIPRGTPATEVLMRRIESEIQRKPSMTPDEKRDYIATLLSVGGFTYEEIAERVGVSRKTVQRVNVHRQRDNDQLSMNLDDGTEKVYKGYQAKIVAALTDGPLSPKDLAAAVAGGPAAVNVLGTAPKVLEQDGVIARTASIGRAFSYVLTDRGRTVQPPVTEAPALTPPPPKPPVKAPKAAPPAPAPEPAPEPEHVHVWVCRDCGEVK